MPTSLYRAQVLSDDLSSAVLKGEWTKPPSKWHGPKCSKPIMPYRTFDISGVIFSDVHRIRVVRTGAITQTN